MRKSWIGIGIAGCTLLVAALLSLAFSKDQAPSVKQVQIVKSYPHDETAFSQGLVVEGGQMWEGTGQYGSSTIRKVEIESGKVLTSLPLDRQYFGEGITALNGKIYQLTWRENVGFIYDQATLKSLGTFHYTGEGWGLANDGKYLYLSDGSSTVRVIDPDKFNVVRRIRVYRGARKTDTVEQLNELEFVNGELWANIWYLDQIARISPQTGQVIGWIDASNLWPARDRPSREHVLNGIAYDQSNKKLYLTGKNWPKLFEVTLPK